MLEVADGVVQASGLHNSLHAQNAFSYLLLCHAASVHKHDDAALQCLLACWRLMTLLCRPQQQAAWRR
jgi:hypothetical protein